MFCLTFVCLNPGKSETNVILFNFFMTIGGEMGVENEGSTPLGDLSNGQK